MKELFKTGCWVYNDDGTMKHATHTSTRPPARWRVEGGSLQYSFHGETSWHDDAEVFQEAYRAYIAKLVLE